MHLRQVLIGDYVALPCFNSEVVPLPLASQLTRRNCLWVLLRINSDGISLKRTGLLLICFFEEWEFHFHFCDCLFLRPLEVFNR